MNILLPDVKKQLLDFDSYMISSERANHAEDYIQGLREKMVFCFY